MLQYPTDFTQRIVESLTFEAKGSQRWRRDVQVLMPGLASDAGYPDGRAIVSLGMFDRRRFADLTVHDSDGKRLNLLTRLQHGHVLALTAMQQYLNPVQLATIAQAHADTPVARSYALFYTLMVELFTSVEGAAEVIRDKARAIALALYELLTHAGSTSDERIAARKLVAADFVALGGVTQYLCWIDAAPAQTLTLRVEYTMSDAAELAGPLRRRPDPSRRFSNLRDRYRIARTRLYARSGFAPMYYALKTPAHDHTSSYYLTLQPPTDAKVTYLDWGLGNSIDHGNGEVECGSPSVHIYNGPVITDPPGELRPRQSISRSTVHTFIRAAPIDHRTVVFGAVLNLVFVYLAEAGRLSSKIGGSATPWLLLTPAALAAYIARQESHYYSKFTTWLRAVIWSYLAINVGYLITLAFDVAADDSFLNRSGVTDDLSSATMALSSLIVALLFALTGNWTERVIVRRFKKRDSSEWSLRAYARVVRRYGDTVAITVGLAVAILIVAFALGWRAGTDGRRGPLRATQSSARSPAATATPGPSATPIPSAAPSP